MRAPDMYASWLVWRKFFREEKTNMYTETGFENPTKANFINRKRQDRGFPPGEECPICQGWGQTTMDGVTVYCMCSLLDWEYSLRTTQDELFTRPEMTKLEDMKPYGDPQTKMKLTNYLKSISAWVKDPTMWLTISGPVGTGKTHVLKSIYHLFKPVALYVSATEFESKVFTWMKEDQMEQGLAIINNVPILLYDDLGADYGGKFVESQLRKIIDFRYSHALNHITVITTNLSVRILTSNASTGDRVASRILAKQLVEVIDLNNVSDYRLSTGRI